MEGRASDFDVSNIQEGVKVEIERRGLPVSECCGGEYCTMCHYEKTPATHKVGEELLHDDLRAQHPHHNMTAYVCCLHYCSIFNLRGCCHAKG